MRKKSESLSVIQERCIAALLTTPSIKDAAKEIGITSRTIFLWLNDEKFSEAYRQARSKTVGLALAEIQKAMPQAIAALKEVMENREAPPSARVSAARAVLELAERWTQTEDLIGRVEVLEKKIAQKGVKQ